MTLRKFKMRFNTGFWIQNARSRVKDSCHIDVGVEDFVAMPNFIHRQFFEGEIVSNCAGFGPCDHIAAVRAKHHSAGLEIKVAPGFLFQLGPELVGALDNLYVGDALCISLSDDSGFAVGRALIVGRGVAVKPNNS